MEFLNGLKTPLELEAGKVCQKAGRLVTPLAVLRVPPSAQSAESRPLGQNAQDTGLWQSSRSSVYVDYRHSATHPLRKGFQKGVFVSSVVNVKSLDRQTG